MSPENPGLARFWGGPNRYPWTTPRSFFALPLAQYIASGYIDGVSSGAHRKTEDRYGGTGWEHETNRVGK